MGVSIKEEVGRDQDPYVHIDGQFGTSSGHVVDQYDKLHPALPFVRLVPVQ